MDRAFGCGPKGWEFNSPRGRKRRDAWSGLSGWFRKPCGMKIPRGFKSLSRRMNINSYWLWEVPSKLDGLAIIVDTFAAMTNLSIILSNNPHKLVIINDRLLSKAKEIYKDGLVVGESSVFPKNTFVCSNYPSDIAKHNFTNKTVLYMTLNGTRAIELVWKLTKNVIGCSFNNMNAVKQYVNREKIQTVHIIKSGESNQMVLEDEMCAEVIMKELQGKVYNWDDIVRRIKDYLYNYYTASLKDFESFDIAAKRNKYFIVPSIYKNNKNFLEVIKK